ncbi:PREDICTED: protein lifeguard 3-like isoform X2 [Papilio xuthus]|uniref:Protein lifeguard 3-like isoform X2 n=1 Tax=Papilio xuthus TaxID=66420 RepID=A0AAJ6ZAX4_PAPXU|nr:PREDICTED: protein lifeguard 3-like isoform X2 [Papilio xuthus]
MKAEETVVTIIEDDTSNKAGSDGNKDEDKYKVFNDSTQNGPQKDIEKTEIPLCEIPKEKSGKSKAFGDKVYVVAYNSVQPQRIQRAGGIGPPLYYDPARNDFVRVVLILVLVMLLITAAVLAMVNSSDEWRDMFVSTGTMLPMLALLLLMGVNYAFICSACARYPPCNFVCLLLAVVAMTILAAFITSHYRTEIVLYATIATAAVVFVCVILAFTSFDFTAWILYVIVISVALSVIIMIVVLMMLITGQTMKPVVLALLILATLVQCVMLTIELQSVLGGRSVELSEYDYALGAFMIYTSIISIFLKIVQILGILDDG